MAYWGRKILILGGIGSLLFWGMPGMLGHFAIKAILGKEPYQLGRASWTRQGLELSNLSAEGWDAGKILLQITRQGGIRVHVRIEDLLLTSAMFQKKREAVEWARPSLPVDLELCGVLRVEEHPLPTYVQAQAHIDKQGIHLSGALQHGLGELCLEARQQQPNVPYELSMHLEQMSLPLLGRLIPWSLLDLSEGVSCTSGTASGHLSGSIECLSGDLAVQHIEASLPDLQLRVGMQEGLLSMAGLDTLHLAVSRQGWISWGKTGLENLEGMVLWTDHPEFDLHGNLSGHPEKHVHLSHRGSEANIAARLELLRVPMRPAIAEVGFAQRESGWESALFLHDFATEETRLLNELLQTHVPIPEGWSWDIDGLEASASLFWEKAQLERVALHQLEIRTASLKTPRFGTLSCNHLHAQGEGAAAPSSWRGSLHLSGLSGALETREHPWIQSGEVTVECQPGKAPAWALFGNTLGGHLQMECSSEGELSGHLELDLQDPHLLSYAPQAHRIGDLLCLDIQGETSSQLQVMGQLHSPWGDFPLTAACPFPSLNDLSALPLKGAHLALPYVPFQLEMGDTMLQGAASLSSDALEEGWSLQASLLEGSYTMDQQTTLLLPQTIAQGQFSSTCWDLQVDLLDAKGQRCMGHFDWTPSRSNLQGDLLYGGKSYPFMGKWRSQEGVAEAHLGGPLSSDLEWTVSEETPGQLRARLNHGHLAALPLERADFLLSGGTIRELELMTTASKEDLLLWVSPWISSSWMETLEKSWTLEKAQIALRAASMTKGWSAELHALEGGPRLDLRVQHEGDHWALHELRLGDLVATGTLHMDHLGCSLDQLTVQDSLHPDLPALRLQQIEHGISLHLAQDIWNPLCRALSEHIPDLRAPLSWLSLTHDLEGTITMTDCLQVHLPQCHVCLKKVPLDLEDLRITQQGDYALMTGQFCNYGEQEPFFLQVEQHPSGTGEAHLTLGVESSTLAWTFDSHGKWVPLRLIGSLRGQQGDLLLDPKVHGRLQGVVEVDLKRLRPLLPQKVYDGFTELGLGEGLQFLGTLDFGDSDLALDGVLKGHQAHLFHTTWASVTANVYCGSTAVSITDLILEEGPGTVCVPLILMHEPDPTVEWQIEIPLVHARHLRASEMRWPRQWASSVKFLEIEEATLEEVAGPLEQIEQWSGHGFVRFENEAPRPALFALPSELLGTLGLDWALLEPVRGTIHYAFEEGCIRLKELEDVVSTKRRSHFALHPDPRFNRIGFDGSLNIRVTMKQHVLFRLMEPLNLYITGSLEGPEVSFQHSDKRCQDAESCDALSRASSPPSAETVLTP